MASYFSKAVSALRRKQSETVFWSHNFSDNFLQRFLTAREFDLAETMNLLQNYIHATKRESPMFKLPSQLKMVFDANAIIVLQNNVPSGESVCIMRFGFWNPDKYDYLTLMSALVATFELLFFDKANQTNGIIMVMDMDNCGWKQLRAVGPLECKHYADMERILPIKFKEFHVINNPPMAEVANVIFVPLLSDKIREKIVFHGSELKTLHRTIPIEILPVEYGGHVRVFTSEYWYGELLQNEGRLKLLWDDLSA